MNNSDVYRDGSYGQLRGYRVSETPDEARRREAFDLRFREETRQAAEDSRARTVFAAADKDLKSDDPANTAAGVALGYSARVANIMSLVTNGMWDEAHDEYRSMENDATRFRTELMDFASTRPSDNLRDKDIQTGAESYAKRAFDAAVVRSDQLAPEGATLGSLFRDGKTYKRFRRDEILSNHFTQELADAYRNGDDPFRQRIAQTIADPVLAHRGTGPHQHRIQLNDVGAYVMSEFDAIRGELGDQGMTRLISDVVDKRVAANTAIDVIKNVRSWVSDRRNADHTAEPASLVGNYLRQYDRMLQSTTVPGGDPKPADSAQRLVTKVMTAVNEYSRNNVDYDNPEVRSAMEDVMEVVATADRMDIALLGELDEGGVNLRSAFGDYVTAASERRAPSEDNPIINISNGFNLATELLSGGCQPVPAAQRPGADPREGRGDPLVLLGSTSGSASVDSLRARMWRTLVRGYLVPAAKKNVRSDLALRQVSESVDTLAEEWSRDIEMATGLSSDAAGYAAGELARTIAPGDGGFRQLDVSKTLSDLAFRNDKVPDPVKKELIRFFKTQNLAGDVLSELERPLTEMLTDPVIGRGLKDKLAIQSVLASYRDRAMILMEHGDDPTPMYRKLGRMGSYLYPTGSYILADGTQVSADDFARIVRSDRERAESATPVIARSPTADDLDLVHIRGLELLGSSFPDLPPGSFSGNREGFRSYQQFLGGILAQNMKLAADEIKDAREEQK